MWHTPILYAHNTFDSWYKENNFLSAHTWTLALESINQSFELKTQFNSGLVTWYLSDGELEVTPMVTTLAWGLGKDIGWRWHWKQFLAKWLACPQTKQKISFPGFLSLGLLLLLKALHLFLEKEGFLPNLFLLNLCFFKDLEKGLLLFQASSKINLWRRQFWNHESHKHNFRQNNSFQFHVINNVFKFMNMIWNRFSINHLKLNHFFTKVST